MPCAIATDCEWRQWGGALERQAQTPGQLGWQAESLAVVARKNRTAELRWWAERIGKQNAVTRDNADNGIGNRPQAMQLRGALGRRRDGRAGAKWAGGVNGGALRRGVGRSGVGEDGGILAELLMPVDLHLFRGRGTGVGLAHMAVSEILLNYAAFHCRHPR